MSEGAGGYGDQPSAGGDAPQTGMPDDQRSPEGDPRAETLPDSDPGTLGTTSADLPRGWDEAVDLTKDPAVIPDLAETHVPEELKKTIEAAMARYPDRRSAVMPALHAAQDLHGWCSPEALHQVAAVMQLTPAYLSMIASFYDMYNEEPVGRHHVYVCTGVACFMKNPRRVLEALQREAEAESLEDTEIRAFECLGACEMAPMASVDGRYIGPLEPEDANEIVESIRAGRKPLPGRGLGDPDYRLPWGGRA
jgi:NADH:ubiquinone oxidoreductase subunit E